MFKNLFYALLVKTTDLLPSLWFSALSLRNDSPGTNAYEYDAEQDSFQQK